MGACPVAIEELERSALDATEAVTLPPECFTSPEFYAFELDAIWSREWFCLGRKSDVAEVGDYFTATVGNEPLIVSRTAAGEVAVLSSVCRHRGMIVAEDSGNAKRFRCPFHWWTYDLDGALIGAPDMNQVPSFEKRDYRLPRIRSELWEGFVFATFNDEAPPLAERLGELSEFIANWRVGSLRAVEGPEFVEVPWNWKVLGTECYHCSKLHHDSWHKWLPTPTDRVDQHSPYNDVEKGVISYDLIPERKDAMPTETGKALHPIIEGLTEQDRERQHYFYVAPNMILVCCVDMMRTTYWLPNSPETSLLNQRWHFPETTIQRPEFWDLYTAEREHEQPVYEEDEWASRQCQKGLRSRFAGRGPYAPTEEVNVRVNQWLVARYRAAARETTEAVN